VGGHSLLLWLRPATTTSRRPGLLARSYLWRGFGRETDGEGSEDSQKAQATEKATTRNWCTKPS